MGIDQEALIGLSLSSPSVAVFPNVLKLLLQKSAHPLSVLTFRLVTEKKI
jgi:hypothetical protein